MAAFSSACLSLWKSIPQFLRQQWPHCFSLQVIHKSSEATISAEDGKSIKRRPTIGQSKCLTDTGTRSIFTEEHDVFREHVRRFFRNEVVPQQERWEKQRHVDRGIWKKMGSAGLLAVNIAEEKGGVGGDFRASMIVLEEQFYANGVGTAWLVHSDIVMPYIADYGTRTQIDQFIPAMTAGTNIGAIAMTEPNAGSDLQGVKTYAKRDGDDWILNGSKTFISNGYLADTVIVVAITDLDAKTKAHGMSLFLVQDGMPGFSKGRPLEKIGQKSIDIAELFFDNVRLPASSLIGGEANLGKGFYMMMQQLPRERLIVGVMAQAHAEAMFEITLDYVCKRKAFGKKLSNLQTIQHRLAQMKTELCVSRAFVDQCILLQEEGKLDSSSASMCKLWATDMCIKLSSECVQLHGGWGYMWEFPIAKAFADSRVHTIYGGSNEIMKELIARAIVSDK
ncbi:Long-chain specific acyl-CoA dehydrogenase, mitochondrial [Holothuria leucospilota]|uniref:Long-chain specific acyl-CoA dehydrogenase, mitochondrial n=1 Tax=Holothuria leucospilota TaxID=206669 RepID=A0A9Q1C0G2_HOLLE|nr:Long-chain specific acyl-CoA dehydrogenase, mitochondrial [Holothuria leucospilota]